MKAAREKQAIHCSDSDGVFAFIVGYTSGGAPYGLTWEENETLEQLERQPHIETCDDDGIHIDDEPDKCDPSEPQVERKHDMDGMAFAAADLPFCAIHKF
jgi:hypothetical protein